MKKTYMTLLLAAVALLASAAAPNESGTYYQNANGKKGSALKTALCGIIYNRSEQTYSSLWTAFYSTDVRAGGENKLWDMYSNKTPYLTLGTNQDTGSGNAEGQYYNREHSFPQSWFGGENKAPMYTDLHHIYPTDKFVNGKRANYPFGETNGETYKSANNFSKLGACTYSGYTGRVFEPANEYKGDFARTYFYMVTCYEEKLQDWVTNYGGDTDVDEVLDGSTYPGLKSWQLNMLMAWATADPVSEKEINRNNAVYGIQNNRNPFIDYPGLEQYIWGNKTDVAFSYDNYEGGSSGSGEGGDPDPGTDPNPGSAGTYKLTITPDDFNTTSYNANNNEKTSQAVCTTDASKTYEVKWTSYQVMRGGDKMQWQKGSGYIYNSTDLGTIQSVTVAKWSNQVTFTTYYGIAEAPSESTEVGGGYFKTVVGNDLGYTTSVEIIFTIGDEPIIEPQEGNYFTKITSMSDFEDGGTYLIVYETGSKAFNGALDTLDVANNCISVTIEDYKIAATPDVMSATFTIASKTTGGYSIKSASERYIGNTSDANGLKRSAEDKYTNGLSFGITDGNVYIQSSSSYLRYNSGASENRFRYFKSSTYTQQQAIQLYKYIPLPSQTVSVGDTGYATMVADANLVIPSGVQAFAVQVKPGYASAYLVPVTDGIPQGEAVVIKASEGTYNFLYASNQVDAIDENDLVPATTAVTSDGSQYCLAHKNDAVGFYRVQSGITIPKGKAYIVLTGNYAKPFYGFDEDDPTGINEELRMKNEESSIYNLAGQRLDNSQLKRGIYIIGGKKVMIK